MKGYTQIAALLEKGIAGFLLLFGATMVMLMAGLIFVLLSQVGVLVKLSAAVALIFDSAGSLEAIFILLLKLIDLALIAVLITIRSITASRTRCSARADGARWMTTRGTSSMRTWAGSTRTSRTPQVAIRA